jgi:hypothetical protein
MHRCILAANRPGEPHTFKHAPTLTATSFEVSCNPPFCWLGWHAAAQATAIRDGLKSLFAEPRLPDNPYYYLASALGAYVDQNDLWQESDLSLLTALDNEGGLEVADQSSRLCKLASCGNVWGLPHVLRCVSKEGKCKGVQIALQGSRISWMQSNSSSWYW